jgi:hypothetical protein
MPGPESRTATTPFVRLCPVLINNSRATPSTALIASTAFRIKFRMTCCISKCGDRRVRTLLYEAANVMLTRYKGQLKLKDRAFAIAARSPMRKARVALARRLAIIMHAMLRDGTESAFD